MENFSVSPIERTIFMLNEKKQLQLYLHLPFCQRKCNYCDFLSAPADESTKNNYIVALKQEIRLKSAAYAAYSVPSVFIGGGTPSVFDGAVIAGLMDVLAGAFFLERDAEITIECNPGTLNRKKAVHYRQAGINRISLGLQSTSDDQLRLLGRIHTFEDFLRSYDAARKAGFDNLNVDLMSGLPGQRLSDWQDTLKKTVALRPEHISAYSLLIEEGTPFFDRYAEDEQRRAAGEEPLFLPSEETERQMYHDTKEYLSAHGYHRYEISNYAKPGHECDHNVGYWKRRNYLGLGLGSASLIENERFHNTLVLTDYLKGRFDKQDLQKLSRREQMEEFLFLGLRMTEGIAIKAFYDQFGLPLDAVYAPVVAALCRQGLLGREAGRLFLNESGISLSNYVLAQFLLPDE